MDPELKKYLSNIEDGVFLICVLLFFILMSGCAGCFHK